MLKRSQPDATLSLRSFNSRTLWPKVASALLYLVFSTVVHSQEKATPVHPVGLDSISKLLLALIVVLGVIFLAAWVFKRLNLMTAFKNPYFNVLASHSLGARERVVLMTVGDKQILLGVTANNVRTLHVFDEPIEVVAEPAPVSFADKLATVMQRVNK